MLRTGSEGDTSPVEDASCTETAAQSSHTIFAAGVENRSFYNRCVGQTLTFKVGDIILNHFTGERGRVVRVIEVGGLIQERPSELPTPACAVDPAEGHVSYTVSIDEGPSSVGKEISKRETLWIESQIEETNKAEPAPTATSALEFAELNVWL